MTLVSRKNLALIELVARQFPADDNLAFESRHCLQVTIKNAVALSLVARIVFEPAPHLLVQRGLLCTGAGAGGLDNLFLGAERDVFQHRYLRVHEDPVYTKSGQQPTYPLPSA